MNLMTIPYRTSHTLVKGALKLIKIPSPPVLSGGGLIRRFPEIIALCGTQKPLIITDDHIIEAHLIEAFTHALDEKNLDYAFFSKAQPNPTFETIYNGLEAYYEHNCDSIIAFGGGSVIDCGKIIAAKVTNDKPIPKMKGFFKLTYKLPPFFAVPTTAGSGSETSIFAMLTDASAHKKIVISDTKLVPMAVCLDPELILTLSPQKTAETSMCALTHAIEAYIGKFATHQVKEKALSASTLILKNLIPAYHDGHDRTYRQNLLQASFDAGQAFTRSYGGYTHAIAHVLSGYYNLSHGEICGIVLPHVLDYVLPSCTQTLAELAIAAEIGDAWDNTEDLAHQLIAKIREMNTQMHLGEEIPELNPVDIPELAKRILAQANKTYPVPRFMDYNTCVELLGNLLSEYEN